MFATTYPTLAQHQAHLAEARRLRAAAVAGAFRSMWRAIAGTADRLAGGPAALAR